MSTRAPFLSTRYGGYLHRQGLNELEEFTHVPPAPTQDEDDKLLGETGRKLAEESVNNPPLRAY